MQNTILSLKGVTKRYPGVVALDKISVDFKKGEVHALLGENGAGKSTMIKAITGAIDIDEGVIEFEGKEYKGFTTSSSRDLGISAVYQESNLVTQISVANNIFLGDYKTKGAFVDDDAMNKKAEEILHSLGFNVNVRKQALLLSEAQKQLVEIGRALVRNLKVIILDEPTSALMNAEVDMLFDVIQKLKERGITVIYITHRIEELFRIADRVTIMRDGTWVNTVNIADVDRASLISAMVGRAFVESYPKLDLSKVGETVLKVDHLSGDAYTDISFEVKAGEILGFAGLIGAGRTEIARGVFGADSIKSGKIYMHGKEVRIKEPKDAIKHRIGYIPEERKTQGLFLIDSIRHNVSIASINGVSKFGFVNHFLEKEKSDKYCLKMRVKAPSFETKVMNLSGGNQQKVLVAKWMATQCDVVFFDEPTRGIDIGARREIYDLMVAMAAEGLAIVLISSDMMEIMGMCNRIMVFYEGSLVGELPGYTSTQEQIMQYASGYKSIDK